MVGCAAICMFLTQRFKYIEIAHLGPKKVFPIPYREVFPMRRFSPMLKYRKKLGQRKSVPYSEVFPIGGFTVTITRMF